MSGNRVSADISHTEQATHVYVKRDTPLSLTPKFEGPYKILDRPSRSQVTVQLGTKKDGSVRQLTFHWSNCKIAHLRDGAVEAERPKLGRPIKKDSSNENLEPEVEPANFPENGSEILPTSDSRRVATDTSDERQQNSNRSSQLNKRSRKERARRMTAEGKKPAEIQIAKDQSTENENSRIAQGGAGQILQLPPKRSTRNPNPSYRGQ